MDADLRERFEAWVEAVASRVSAMTPEGVRVDAHTHLGVDAGTGLEMTVDSLERQMRIAGIERAIVIPLNASDGYHRTSLRLAARAGESAGRFAALYRLDPGDDQLEARVREGFRAGCAGLKLHPASDQCDPLDPAVAPALELAQERSAVVLVHTGVDVDHAASNTIEAARRYPGARFVLGHVPAESLGEMLAAAGELDNVWTCLSWWGAVDVSYAIQASEPSRLLFGSDPPYGHVVTGFAQTVLVARALGLDDDAVRGIVGGNAERLLDPARTPPSGTRPPDLREATDLLARLPLAFRRCYLALLAAVSTAWEGGSPSSYYRFAEQSLEPRAIEDQHEGVARRTCDAIHLARDLHLAEAREQSYAVGVVALTEALTGPVLADRDD